MRTHINQAAQLRLLIGGVAAILLGTCGIAVVMAWGPGAPETKGTVFALDKLATQPAGEVDAEEQIFPEAAEGGTRIRAKCAQCGVVEATREIGPPAGGINAAAAGRVMRGGRNEMGAQPARNYEVVVRLKDGSNRVLMHETTANWRAGERLIFIEGAHLASN